MFQSKPRERVAASAAKDGSAGFTLIEALVALAVVAISLTAIGSLMAANIRGSVRIEQHLGLVETARALELELPGRNTLPTGTLTGELAGHSWSVDVLPFPDKFAGSGAANRWAPQMVLITVRSPSGSLLQVDTVRLRRRTTQ